MGQVSFRTDDLLSHSLKVKNDLRFRQIKIEGSSLHPLLTKSPREEGHPFQGCDDRFKPLSQLLILIQQNPLDDRVGPPFMALDDAWIETISPGLTIGIKSQLNREGEPVHFGTEATDLIG